MIGLRIHTTASLDGQHWPREIFEMASEGTSSWRLSPSRITAPWEAWKGEGLRDGSYELVERLKLEKMARDTQAHGILRKGWQS